jgi:hypothetical protein
MKRSDVNGNVKSNYQANADLLLTFTKLLIVEQAMAYFSMDSPTDTPSCYIRPEGIDTQPRDIQMAAMKQLLRGFLAHYNYGSVGESPRKPTSETIGTTYTLLGYTKEGQMIVKQDQKPTLPKPKPDYLMNYCMNLCHRGLHLMELNDTAK